MSIENSGIEAVMYYNHDFANATYNNANGSIVYNNASEPLLPARQGLKIVNAAVLEVDVAPVTDVDVTLTFNIPAISGTVALLGKKSAGNGVVLTYSDAGVLSLVVDDPPINVSQVVPNLANGAEHTIVVYFSSSNGAGVKVDGDQKIDLCAPEATTPVDFAAPMTLGSNLAGSWMNGHILAFRVDSLDNNAYKTDVVYTVSETVSNTATVTAQYTGANDSILAIDDDQELDAGTVGITNNIP